MLTVSPPGGHLFESWTGRGCYKLSHSLFLCLLLHRWLGQRERERERVEVEDDRVEKDHSKESEEETPTTTLHCWGGLPVIQPK